MRFITTLIVSLHAARKLARWWTSGSDIEEQGRWKWTSTGEAFDYSNWSEEERAGYTFKGRFMQLGSALCQHQWYTFPHDSQDFFICEYLM